MATHQKSNQRVRHVVCTQTEYDALVSSNAINSTYLYYITDKACLYKGSTKLSFNKEIVSAADLTSISSPKTDTLYVSSASKAVGIYHNSAWVILSPGYISTIADNQASSNDGKLVTSAAVINYVASKVRNLVVVNVDDPTTSIQSPVANTIYFSSTTNKSAFWDGTSWLVLHGKHRGFVIVGANITFTESGLSTAGLLSTDTVYAQPSTKKIGYYDPSSNWYLLSDGGSNLTVVSYIDANTPDSSIPNVGAVKDFILNLLYDIGGQYQDESRTFMVYDGDTAVETNDIKKKLNWTFYETAQNLDDYNYTDNGVVEVIKTDGYRDAGLANPLDSDTARVIQNGEYEKPYTSPLFDAVLKTDRWGDVDEQSLLTPFCGIDDGLSVATGTLDYRQTDPTGTYATENRSSPFVPTDVLSSFDRAGFPPTYTFLSTFTPTIDHVSNNGVPSASDGNLYDATNASFILTASNAQRNSASQSSELYGIHYLNMSLLWDNRTKLSSNQFIDQNDLLTNQYPFIRHPVPKFALDKTYGVLFMNDSGTYKEVEYVTPNNLAYCMLNQSIWDRRNAIDGTSYLSDRKGIDSVKTYGTIVSELGYIGFTPVEYNGKGSAIFSNQNPEFPIGVVNGAKLISIGEFYTNQYFAGAVGINVARPDGIIDELLLFPGPSTQTSVKCVVFCRRRLINISFDELIVSLTGGPGVCDADPMHILNSNPNVYSTVSYNGVQRTYNKYAHHSGYLLTSKKKLYGNYTNYFISSLSWDLIASNVAKLSGFSVDKTAYGPNLTFTPRRALIITSDEPEHPGEDPVRSLGTVGFNRYVYGSGTDYNNNNYTKYGTYLIEMMDFKNVITQFKYATVEPVAIAGSTGIGYHNYYSDTQRIKHTWSRGGNPAFTTYGGEQIEYTYSFKTTFGYGSYLDKSMTTDWAYENTNPDPEPVDPEYPTGYIIRDWEKIVYHMEGSAAPCICGGVLFKITSDNNTSFCPIAIGPVVRVKNSANGTLMFLTGNALLGHSQCGVNYNDMNGNTTGNCIYKKPVTMRNPDNGEYWEKGGEYYVCDRFIGTNFAYFWHDADSRENLADESCNTFNFQCTDDPSFMTSGFWKIVSQPNENIPIIRRKYAYHDFYSSDGLDLYDYLTLDISPMSTHNVNPVTRSYGTTFYSTQGATDPCVYAPFQIMRQDTKYINDGTAISNDLGFINFNNNNYDELRVERFELVAHNNFAIIFSSK